MINFAKRQVDAHKYFSALGNSALIFSHFQLEEGCEDHLASILNALVSG